MLRRTFNSLFLFTLLKFQKSSTIPWIQSVIDNSNKTLFVVNQNSCYYLTLYFKLKSQYLDHNFILSRYNKDEKYRFYNLMKKNQNVNNKDIIWYEQNGEFTKIDYTFHYFVDNAFYLNGPNLTLIKSRLGKENIVVKLNLLGKPSKLNDSNLERFEDIEEVGNESKI
mgnify:FL=1